MQKLLLSTTSLFLLVAGCPSPETTDDAGVIDAGPTYAEPFTVDVAERAWLSSLTSQNSVDAFDLGDGPFTSVVMRIDVDTACQPFDSWGTADNPIPPGHNWPAACDAYDRNMNFIVDKAGSDDDAPGFALLRSITSFGGPRHMDVDVTDWANAHPGEHVLHSHITTWVDGNGQVSGSEGGWWVSVAFDVEPGPAPRNVLAAYSLFEGNVTNAASLQRFDVDMPAGATSAALHYVTSGHGGGAADADCIGHADEFCERVHQVTFNGRDLNTFIPWRTDCGDFCTLETYTGFGQPMQYCAENPCGSVQSVQAPRANWCPGDDVHPFIFDDLPLDEGTYEATFEVRNIADGGSWGTWFGLYVYGD